MINLSLGDTQSDAAEESAVANAIAGGVVVVAASGNGTGDPAKAESARIFLDAWKKAEAKPAYARMKVEWQEKHG